MKINNLDELIQLIDKSACFKDKNYNYDIFYDYVIAEDKRIKIEKKIVKKDMIKHFINWMK